MWVWFLISLALGCKVELLLVSFANLSRVHRYRSTCRIKWFWRSFFFFPRACPLRPWHVLDVPDFFFFFFRDMLLVELYSTFPFGDLNDEKKRKKKRRDAWYVL
uniref:Putative secreted protein n=1 Tax=Ixodes ricinus TaxID=34613 RepID=A0A6B0U827_IXORI